MLCCYHIILWRKRLETVTEWSNISILSNEARNNCGIKTLCVSKIPQASSCSAFIVTAQKCFSWIVNISRRIQSIGLRRIPLFLDGTPNGYFVYCPIKSAIYLLDFLQFSNFFTLFRFFFFVHCLEKMLAETQLPSSERNSISYKWTIWIIALSIITAND